MENNDDMPELTAYKERLNHSHRFSPFGEGYELCSCGAIRETLQEHHNGEEPHRWTEN